MRTQRIAPPRVRLVWAVTAASYFMCGTVLSGYGLLYNYISTADVIFGIELLGVSVQPGLFPYMSAANLLIALIHFYYLAIMMHRSIRTQSLQFSQQSGAGTSRIEQALTTAFDSAIPPRSSCLGFALRSLGDITVALWSTLDVSNPNYGVVYIISEIIQTAIQTNQAYQLSARVASPGMNHVIVILLVINCWAMPLIRYVLQIRSTQTARLLCLVINFALDFVAYFAYPIALFVPYAKDFDPSIKGFTKDFWYTDVWFMQLKNEWPLVFTTSVWDALSRLLIAFTMTTTLLSMTTLLQPHQPKVGPQSDAFTVRPFASARVLPSASLARVTSSLQRLPSVPVIRSHTEEWGHRFLALWGLLVLIIHVEASSTRRNPQCLLQVRPWFVRRPVCSLMDINCLYDSNLTGNAADFDSALSSIDSKWLSYLVIRHCPSVEITPRINDLSWLMGIKIFNSTLEKWDEDAALTQTHHPNMVFTFVITTNVSAFPQGLYHPDVPSKLNDIEFSFVNLTEIPAALADRWHAGMYLVMEGLQLTTFPDVLTKLQPSYLSLASNSFVSIPVAVFENPELVGLILNDNPIHELPIEHETVSELSIVKTNIAHAPLWFDISQTLYQFQAGSTPLCDALSRGDMSALGMTTEAEMELWQRYADCTPAGELRYISNYQLSEEAFNNPSRIP